MLLWDAKAPAGPRQERVNCVPEAAIISSSLHPLMAPEEGAPKPGHARVCGGCLHTAGQQIWGFGDWDKSLLWSEPHGHTWLRAPYFLSSSCLLGSFFLLC